MVLIIMLSQHFLIVDSKGVSYSWAWGLVPLNLLNWWLWSIAFSGGELVGSQIVPVNDLSLIRWDTLRMLYFLVKLALTLNVNLMEIIDSLDGAREVLSHPYKVISVLLGFFRESGVPTVDCALSNIES